MLLGPSVGAQIDVYQGGRACGQAAARPYTGHLGNAAEAGRFVVCYRGRGFRARPLTPKIGVYGRAGIWRSSRKTVTGQLQNPTVAG